MKKNRKSILLLIVGGLVALSVIVGVIAFIATQVGGTDSSDGSEPSSSASTSEISTTGTLSSSGEPIGVQKENARDAAIEMLSLTAENPTDVEMNARIAKIAEGDESVINEELLSYIRFEDLIDADEDLRANTLQSVVAIATSMEDSGGIGAVEEGIATALVYVDVDAGVAYVPLSSLSANGLPVSLEMIYVDGKWQLSPYPLLDMVRLSAMAQGVNPTTGETVNSSGE